MTEQKILRVPTEPLRQWFGRRKLNKLMSQGWSIKTSTNATQVLFGSRLDYVEYVLEKTI